MDGLFRCLTVPVGISLGGRDFALHPITLASFAQIELHLLAARRSPVDDAVGQHSDIQQDAVAIVAADRSERVVRLKDVYAWLETPAGLAFTGWMCLAPAFESLAACQAFFTTLPSADQLEFVRRRDMASGMDLLTHLDWLTHSDAGDKSTFINWRRVFRALSEEYHWTPEQIGRLTLYQLRVCRVPENQLGGRARMSPAEAFHFVGMRKANYDPQTMPSRVEARRKMIERRRNCKTTGKPK